MNCKPGDLAVVVLPPRYERSVGVPGDFVQIVHFYPDFDPAKAGWGVVGNVDTRRYLPAERRWCKANGVDALISDHRLRPIRDNDGEDEMLRIAGKPQEKKEIA